MVLAFFADDGPYSDALAISMSIRTPFQGDALTRVAPRAEALYMVSAFRQPKHTVPEGRRDNRPALQRRLVTIPNRPRPGGPG